MVITPFFPLNQLAIEPIAVGAIASFTLISTLVGSPIPGRLFDKIKNMKRLMVIFAIAISAGIALNYFDSFYATICSSIVVGFFAGGSRYIFAG